MKHRLAQLPTPVLERIGDAPDVARRERRELGLGVPADIQGLMGNDRLGAWTLREESLRPPRRQAKPPVAKAVAAFR